MLVYDVDEFVQNMLEAIGKRANDYVQNIFKAIRKEGKATQRRSKAKQRKRASLKVEA